MKIYKLKNGQIKCVLYNDELNKHNININDFHHGSLITQTVFGEIYSAIKQIFPFNEDKKDIKFNIVPLSDKGIEIYISILEPNSEQKHPYEFLLTGIPDSSGYEVEAEYTINISNTNLDNIYKKNNYTNKVAFIFDRISYITRLATSFKKAFIPRNSLYYYQKDDCYILYITKTIESDELFEELITQISEFGIIQPAHKASEEFFEESFQPIIRYTALEDISKYLDGK